MATQDPTFFDWEQGKDGQIKRAVDFGDGQRAMDTLDLGDATTVYREIQVPGGGVARAVLPNAVKRPAGTDPKRPPPLTSKAVAPVAAPTPDAAQQGQVAPPPGLEDTDWSEFAAAGVPKPTVGVPGAAPVAAPMPDSPNFVGPVQPIRDLSNGFVPPSPSPYAGRSDNSRYRGRNQPEPRQTVDARGLPRLANVNAWDTNSDDTVSGFEAGAGDLFKRTGGRVRIARGDGGFSEVQGYSPGEFATNWVSTMKKFKLAQEHSGLQQMANAFKY